MGGGKLYLILNFLFVCCEYLQHVGDRVMKQHKSKRQGMEGNLVCTQGT